MTGIVGTTVHVLLTRVLILEAFYTLPLLHYLAGEVVCEELGCFLILSNQNIRNALFSILLNGASIEMVSLAVSYWRTRAP